MTDYPAAIEEFLRKQIRARCQRLEAACEAAIQGGQYGVMVCGEHSWADPRVPYGWIWDVTACGPDHPNLPNTS